MKKLTACTTIAGIFALGLISTPAAFADDGTTAAGGSASGNAGSSSDKTDKSTQDNAASADKSKQK